MQWYISTEKGPGLCSRRDPIQDNDAPRLMEVLKRSDEI